MFSRHTNRTFLNLGEKKICETTKDTGDNDDHFYVVPSEKIKFIRISNLLIFHFEVDVACTYVPTYSCAFEVKRIIFCSEF